MAFTGRKNPSRKTVRKQTAAAQSARRARAAATSASLAAVRIRRPDPLTPTGALCVPLDTLMARFTATANRLRPISPACHAFSADKKRRVIKLQRPLTFPQKYCIKIQYRVNAIRPTASHLRRPAADGRVAYHRAPSGAAGVGMRRRLPSA